jgi:hypothetical protein
VLHLMGFATRAIFGLSTSSERGRKLVKVAHSRTR